MEIQKRSMNWFPKESAWNELQEQKAKRREMVQEFQEKNQSLANSLGSVFANQISGNAENITRTAVDRIQKQAAEKRAEVLKKLDTFA